MKKRKFLSVFCFSIAIMMLTACKTVFTKTSSQVDRGFETPEKVMEYFSEQIADGDFTAACEVFAINLMAENYDFEKEIERLNTWSPTLTMPYPSDNESYLAANKVFMQSYAMEQISNLCFSLNAEDKYLAYTTVTVENNAAEIAASFELQDLASFELIEMEYASPEIQDSDNYKESIHTRNKTYSSENYEDYQVTYRWNKQSYTGGVTFIKFEDLWYIYSLQSGLIESGYNGYLTKE